MQLLHKELQYSYKLLTSHNHIIPHPHIITLTHHHTHMSSHLPVINNHMPSQLSTLPSLTIPQEMKPWRWSDWRTRWPPTWTWPGRGCPICVCWWRCSQPGAQNLYFLTLPLPPSLLLPLLSLHSPFLPPLTFLSPLQWVVVSCEATSERKPPMHPSLPSHSDTSLSLPENHSNIRRYRSQYTSWCALSQSQTF